MLCFGSYCRVPDTPYTPDYTLSSVEIKCWLGEMGDLLCCSGRRMVDNLWERCYHSSRQRVLLGAGAFPLHWRMLDPGREALGVSAVLKRAVDTRFEERDA